MIDWIWAGSAAFSIVAILLSFRLGYLKGREDERRTISTGERKLIEHIRWQADHRARKTDIGRHLEIIDQINGELHERNFVYRNTRYGELAYGTRPHPMTTEFQPETGYSTWE